MLYNWVIKYLNLVNLKFIIIYILKFIRWELILNKGYQVTDIVSSATTTKVKGQGFLPQQVLFGDMNNIDGHELNNLLSIDHEKHKYTIFDTAGKIRNKQLK